MREISTSNELFWSKMSRGAAYTLGGGLLLWALLILFSQMGCAYFPAKPHYDNLAQALEGKPSMGWVGANDANSIIAVQRGQLVNEQIKDGMKFSQAYAANFIHSNTDCVQVMNGVTAYKVIIENRNRWKAYSFQLRNAAGYVVFSEMLAPSQRSEHYLPPGLYTGEASENGRTTGKSTQSIDPLVPKSFLGSPCYMFFAIDLNYN